MKHDEKLTRYGALVCGLLLVSGCNSYNVQALPYDAGLKSVTVIANPKVAVHDFVDVMVDEFNARNIKVVSAPPNYVAKPEEYIIRYDARRSWDISDYLSDATVRITRDDMTLGKGKYHHVGQSFSFDLFTKWRGTEWKMKDVYDELLKNYPKR